MKKEINNTRSAKRGAAIERNNPSTRYIKPRMREFNVLWCF